MEKIIQNIRDHIREQVKKQTHAAGQKAKLAEKLHDEQVQDNFALSRKNEQLEQNLAKIKPDLVRANARIKDLKSKIDRLQKANTEARDVGEANHQALRKARKRIEELGGDPNEEF